MNDRLLTLGILPFGKGERSTCPRLVAALLVAVCLSVRATTSAQTATSFTTHAENVVSNQPGASAAISETTTNRAKHGHLVALNLIDELKQKAAAGDANAQYALGLHYHNGDSVPQDDVEALKWFRKAAEQGRADAQFILGSHYYFGRGTPQDYAEASTWYRKAAEQGSAGAQNNLGECYLNGQGVPQDYTEAVRWYRQAAAQGLAAAQNNLGVCYLNGRGVPQDYAEAVRWYRKAAGQGLADAQNNLGRQLIRGEGVPQNYVEAYKWLNLAAAQGQKDSVKDRDSVAELMTPEQIAEGQRLASQFIARPEGITATE